MSSSRLRWLAERIEAAVQLVIMQVGSWLPKGIVFNRWLEEALEGNAGLESNVAEARRLAHVLDAVGRRSPVRPLCLIRSLTLSRILRRRHIDARMRLGVRKETDKVAAHAWLEVADDIVNDDRDHCSEYAVLETADALRLNPNQERMA